MIAHVMQRLQPQVSRILINANQNLDRYKTLGVPVCTDEIGNFAGPLAGMHAGLAHCETAYLMTVPCDTPFLPADLVARLAAALQDSDAEIAVAKTQTQHVSQRQPVCCLMKQTLLTDLRSALELGVRKVDNWLAEKKTTDVLFDDATAFANINTAEELKQYEHF